ncbi:MAG: NADH-quinone oxidoreductase subunit D [Bdellovibrionaceae bacterium]|jgi:NADH-quinone oxidoreductase subunit D|nr:NADH-quinone oxidoreductase subunit D [Pseudobdellovibrionaceae bacterium]
MLNDNTDPIELKTLQDQFNLGQKGLSGNDTQEFFVNMGPQHPSTHGVLRLVLKMDGENVKKVIPVLGYIHRGIEKMSEYIGARQIVPLTDRMDYLSAMSNNWGISRAVELAMGVETNSRIETIRTLMAELQRMQSHMLWWGVLGLDLGAVTTFFYGFRDREFLTELMEKTTGSRLTMNYIQPGGLMFDIHEDFVKDVKAFLKYFKPKLEEYEILLSGNVILQNRLRGVGVLSSDDALSFSCTGPTLRASGVPLDLRKTEKYGVYDQVEFDVPVGEVGDCWDRYWVRLEEIKQSMHIIEQLIDDIPEGKFTTLKPAKKLKIPAGTTYSQVETPRGSLGTFIQGDGTAIPYRLHFRTPNFNNLWAITKLGPGGKLADLVATLSTLDLVIPDIDR